MLKSCPKLQNQVLKVQMIILMIKNLLHFPYLKSIKPNFSKRTQSEYPSICLCCDQLRIQLIDLLL